MSRKPHTTPTPLDTHTLQPNPKALEDCPVQPSVEPCTLAKQCQQSAHRLQASVRAPSVALLYYELLGGPCSQRSCHNRFMQIMWLLYARWLGTTIWTGLMLRRDIFTPDGARVSGSRTQPGCLLVQLQRGLRRICGPSCDSPCVRGSTRPDQYGFKSQPRLRNGTLFTHQRSGGNRNWILIREYGIST